MKENFDLILFDLDGTITDSGEGITKSVQYALSKLGIEEPDLENLRKFIGPPLIDSFEKYYGFSREEAIRAREIFNERYQPIGWMENRPYDGIEEVLKALKENGKMLGIATSKPADTAERVLTYFGLREYFPVFCASPLNGIGGEKAGRIQAAIEDAKALGCEAKNVIMVGDTKFDVLGAHECHIPCVGVTWGFAVEGEFEACDTEFVVDTMDELLNVLK
ncbi:MAG: HAD hydrolase-like protein [Lachnospiraceae bacterium]|nr:HAD hydrolase-like protein [Lachnospiraceae bacterium]